MFYYTITIMLQSSYLPIPQYLKSPGRSSSYKSPETLTQEYDSLFSRGSSLAFSEDVAQDGSTSSQTRFESDGYSYSDGGNSGVQGGNARSPRHHHHRSSSAADGYFNTAHQICTQLSNVLYHHVELLLDSYPNWCGIQHKLNQTLTAALRVSCLNARLGSNPRPIRDEAKAGFKMGSDLFKRQALLPDPLTVRDWPAEEDVKVMLDLEEEFRELMTTQEEAEAEAESQAALSRSGSRDPTTGVDKLFDDQDGGEGGGEDEELLVYDPYEEGNGGMGGMTSDFADLQEQHQQYLKEQHQFQLLQQGSHLSGQHHQQQQQLLQQQQHGQQPQGGPHDIFPSDHDHVFGLEEGFQFEYNMGA